MACTTKVVADILNNCVRPTKGLKPKAWTFNNGDFTLTKTNNVLSAIVKIGSATAFTAEGFKDFMNAGHDAVVAENLPTAYVHKWMVNANAATAAPNATSVGCGNCALTATSIAALLFELKTTGNSAGYLGLAGGTNAPTSTWSLEALSDKEVLELTYSWFVEVNA